jgi:ferritin-like metal-binding protein YciE
MKKARSQSSGRASTGRGLSAGKSGSSRKSATSATKKSAATGSSSKATSSSRSRAAATAKSSKKSTPSSNGRSKAASSSSRRTSSSRASQASPREGLTEVLKDLMKDIYYAEKQLVKALKKMGKAASNTELKTAFETHMEETQDQVGRLEEAFAAMGIKAVGKKCPAMDGLIEEGNEHMEEMDKGPALDAALIVGAQKVEHYEIAAYGSMRSFAVCLGLSECEEVFNAILEQESNTDEILTRVAQTVNREALSGEDNEGGASNGTSTGGRSGARLEQGAMTA